MSEYEGKVPYRKYARNVDLSDILYYEATGELMSREEKEKVKDIMEDKKIVESTFQEYPPIKFSCTINASDESELRVYLKAHDYLSALRELEQKLRRFDKLGFGKDIETKHALLDKIRDILCNILDDYGIDLREGN